MKKAIAGLMLMTATGAVAATPELPEEYAYLGIHGTQFFHDTNGQRQDSADLDSALLPGLQIGYRFQSDWSVQALYETGELDAEQGSGETDLDTAVIEGRRHFGSFDLAGFEPYAGIAVGHHEFSANGSDDTETLTGIGVGVQRAVASNVFIDVGARHDFILDNSRQDTQVYLGVNYAFGTGGDEPAPTPQQEPAKPQDSDNDGVPDSRDDCPDTPAGTPVNDAGCAIERDSDNDGVTNRNDQCPDTPEGAKVNDQGCHETLKESVRETLNVRFETASANVTEGSLPEIRDVAEAMREFPESTLVLEGHTDSVGNAEANRALSQRRAEAVKQVLVEEMGIAADRVSAEGYGESQPVADNDTAEGRAQNRRVESVLEASREAQQ
ncbi:MULTISPECIES: OmpA family protein [Halomonadaceae]|uniref:OmpA family protein n=1 Tax=Vreelandella halophila TaxID=86177 RepID=A0A9X4YEX1_9GAMM|nr:MULTISPECIES: OmpA family protein [Halomonas]MYL27963.1 OmpA family protein [Halomonas utahensis]MYL75598.1 OmpA family protein [Halomonas sp. 22501_18_FS]